MKYLLLFIYYLLFTFGEYQYGLKTFHKLCGSQFDVIIAYFLMFNLSEPAWGGPF